MAAGTKRSGSRTTFRKEATAVSVTCFEAARNVKPAPRITSANGVAIAERFERTLAGIVGIVHPKNENGSAIATEDYIASQGFVKPLVTSTDSETTSASIDELAGGTARIYTQPLTSLTVASVASSMQEAWLEFTVASGGSVSINDSGYKYLGGRPSAFEGGSSYAVGFRWGRQAVCVPLEE